MRLPIPRHDLWIAPALTTLAPSTSRPYGVPLRQERWEQLPNREISAAGQQALTIKTERWRRDETENFIVHHRSIGDAPQIAREIEFNLWHTAGSAEASIAARHWHPLQSTQPKLRFADTTVAELMAIAHCPEDLDAIARLNDRSATFERYLFNKHPKELFAKSVDRVSESELAAATLVKVYGNEFRDIAEFGKRFARFIH
jgi:hypothetical protein